VTVIVAVPVLPSLVAVIVALPGATPVTSPLDDTVAMAGALDVKEIGRPVSAFPWSSVTCAPSCTVCPTVTLACPGEMMTALTGFGLTVMAAVPVFPSLVAVIVVAVAMPVSDTRGTVATR
jgi:hypothetical protein